MDTKMEHMDMAIHPNALVLILYIFNVTVRIETTIIELQKHYFDKTCPWAQPHFSGVAIVTLSIFAHKFKRSYFDHKQWSV